MLNERRRCCVSVAYRRTVSRFDEEDASLHAQCDAKAQEGENEMSITVL